MKGPLGLVVAQQKVQMPQDYPLGFGQCLLVGRVSLILPRQKLHEQEDQQVHGLLVSFLQLDNFASQSWQVAGVFNHI